MYYAHINSHDILTGIDVCTLTEDEYGSTDVQNIEVSEEVYNNAQQYGNEYYIYDNGEIVLNPEYNAIKLAEAKDNKYNEALNKAYDFEQNGTVEYKNCIFEMTISNRDNLRDTVEALTVIGQTETIWNDKNDELVILTVDDIQYIRLNLILGRIQRLWINDYPTYKEQIADAQTIEDVNSIEIVYN